VFRCDPTTPVSQAVVQLSLRPSHDVAVVAAAHGAVGAGRLKAQAQAQAPHDCHQRTAAGWGPAGSYRTVLCAHL
jgi:hypothetical protein